MTVTVVTPSSGPDCTVEASPVKNARATHAAQEFEALLLGNLLRSMQQSFSSLPGGDEKPVGFDDYHYMATQAIATALAAGGGMGIARLILKQLVRT